MKKILLMAAIVIAGLQTINAQAPQREGGRRNPQEMVDNRVKQLDKKLNLTDQQKQQIKDFMNESFKMNMPEKGKRPDASKREERMKELNSKIESVLTEEQKAKYQKMEQNKGKKKVKANKGDNK